MTFLSELSARAIAFITAIQTALVNAEIDAEKTTEKTSILTISQYENPANEFIRVFDTEKLQEKFKDRATELVETSNWASDKQVSLEYALNLSANLVEWMGRNRKNGISDLHTSYGSFPTPFNWRITIENILYENPLERVTLAISLHYLPLQIVLAMGGGVCDADQQQSLQMWNPNMVDCNKLMQITEEKRHELLNQNDVNWNVLFDLIKKDTNSRQSTKPEKWIPLMEEKNNEWIKILKILPETKRAKNEKNQLKVKRGKEEKEQAKDKESKEMKTTVEKFVFEVINLLLNHTRIIKFLIDQRVPLSFELIFSEELVEIEANRGKRQEEEFITGLRQQPDIDSQVKVEKIGCEKIGLKDRIDPFKKVQQMGIRALAISGGGIRSATFNLGILQGLAEKQLIGKFDYLSTVSGGGYIGSWLTTWIKRNESVVKVSNRLCTQKSPDPAGAELKPIKWLRMYSNYFAPNASLMSVDSWTVGITWLRNTLLNQIVIFLIFLALLFAGNSLYQIWSNHLIHNLYPTWLEVFLWSILFLFPVAYLSGKGMADFGKKDINQKMSRKTKITLSQGIIIIAILGAFFVSAWLSSAFFISGVRVTSIEEKLIIFFPAAIIAFVCLLLVGFVGKYVESIEKFQKNTFWAVAILFIVTLFSAVFGWICLASVSVLLENMSGITFGSNATYKIDKKDLQFILGIPFIIEVFTFAIIARMALLGKYFPDERREWWGRIGASIHRICFLWILVFSSALLGWTFIQFAFDEYAAPSIAATGGWIALVGICVKAAFSSKTADKGEERGRYATFLSILSMVGPYLFILGLLILLPALTKPILFLVVGVLKDLGFPIVTILFQNLLMMIFCAVLAYGLATQLGVNEFSMYNFYKNRLVRAYLGGTRRSTKRQKTANPYTGFDIFDDELLYKFRYAEGYHGPYHILNCALNSSQGQELDRQDRKAESFIFSPLFCGFDFSMARDPTDKNKSYDYAYRQTEQYAFKDGGPFIGTAMAISGAAVNPNQGYHSSPPIAFLLTIFNAQMGRWLGNPRKSSWEKSDPASGLGYIISDLINKSSTSDNFISLSDGGHFDNMGLYEMVRRKCPYIILCDAEQDSKFTCEGLANAIRRCRIDFGAEIIIDISKITERTDERHSKSHYALGEITYVGDNQTGVLLYIKSSITGDEPVDVFEYALKNKTFPHQTTADQFFDEEQFETYRKLGLHIAGKVLSDDKVIDAFKLEDKNESQGDTLKEMENPLQAFYNSIKNFFMENK